MRILIAAIGRARQRPEAALYEAYAARVTAWPLALREIELRKRVAAERRRAAEGAALRDAVPAGARYVVLDGRGKALSSRALARRLASWQDDAVADLAFLIGGADGLDAALGDRAALTLSLGPATWPHLLVRAMLAEQLYRAQQIIAGHPYHRD